MAESFDLRTKSRSDAPVLRIAGEAVPLLQHYEKLIPLQPTLDARTAQDKQDII